MAPRSRLGIGVQLNARWTYHDRPGDSQRVSALTRGPNAVPIVVRLFEPISLLFPESAAMPSLSVEVLNCILCEGPAWPPSRMGVMATPDRQAVFVVCGRGSDCLDCELERRIVAQVSEPALVG